MAISEFLDRDFARRWASALPFNRKTSARPAGSCCWNLHRFPAYMEASMIQKAGQLLPSRPGEFHPEPLTDPDVNLSIHPARATAAKAAAFH
jgi:hypothetical protein